MAWPCRPHGSLPFVCRLLFAFVDAVFGALTVSLQFLGSMDSVAWPGLAPGISCSATWLSLHVYPLFAGRVQAVSDVCLPVLP